MNKKKGLLEFVVCIEKYIKGEKKSYSMKQSLISYPKVCFLISYSLFTRFNKKTDHSFVVFPGENEYNWVFLLEGRSSFPGSITEIFPEILLHPCP